jgi:hypothetical protein
MNGYKRKTVERLKTERPLNGVLGLGWDRRRKYLSLQKKTLKSDVK